ncbi:MAG: 4-alpha-glucanotransferase, partial [Christensenellaceae bacterium]|nr:4-alpha-glucanotransferase [Christensenellaceae bacterium]
DTIMGWLEETNFAGDPEEEREKIIERLESSDAAWAVFPIQDILGLGSSARMNTPGTVSEDGDEGGNWNWRLMPGMLK